LVATPPLGDPNFDRTVVYVLDHGELGAVGVVLNRADDPDLPVDDGLEALSAWEHLLTPPGRVFAGGPVATDALIALATGDGRHEEAWGPVTDEVGTVDLSLAPDEVADRIDQVRIFRGYAGWGPGQLEGEIDAGAWMVFDVAEGDLFTDRPDHLWRAVVRRQGGRLAWIADAPDDISAN
jgi:putative transcriptional regulator